MEKVLEIIDKKQEELRKVEIDEETVKFLNMFSLNISHLCSNEFIDLIICFYMIKYDTTLESAMEEVNKVYLFLEDVKDLDYNSVLELVDTFYDLEVRFGKKLGNRSFDDYIALYENDEVLDDVKTMLRVYLERFSKSEINEFLKWLNNDVLCEIICLAAALKGVEYNLENVQESNPLNVFGVLDSLGNLSREENRRLNKFCGITKKSDYLKIMDKEFASDIEELKRFKEKKTNETTTKKRYVNKQLKNLEQLTNLLKGKKLTVDELLKLTDDEEIIHYSLLEVIKLNNEKYAKKYEELVKGQKNPINVLEKMFNDFNYNFNALTEEEQNILMSLNNEERLAENLRFLSTSSLKFIREHDEVFLNILLLNIEALMQLDSLLLREKINADFILKYGKKFNALTIKTLVKNVNRLDMQRVDFDSILNYNDSILLNLNTNLFDVVTMYGIDFKCPNLKQYEFIENSNLLNVIDSFIEIGLFNQIKNSPNLISESSYYVIKRINIMNKLGIPYINDRNTINQMARSGKDFYIGDDELEEYDYQNYSLFMDNEMLNVLNNSENVEVLDLIPAELSFIEDYKKNDQVYIIGTQCFSRVKVLRCLKTLIDAGFVNYDEILFNSLIYNYPTHLNMDVIEELKNIGKNIQRKQLK